MELEVLIMEFKSVDISDVNAGSMPIEHHWSELKDFIVFLLKYHWLYTEVQVSVKLLM